MLCIVLCAVIIVEVLDLSAQLLTMSVNLSTVQKWSKELDTLGEWLRYGELAGNVMQIFCALHTKHKDRLHALRILALHLWTGSPVQY